MQVCRLNGVTDVNAQLSMLSMKDSIFSVVCWGFKCQPYHLIMVLMKGPESGRGAKHKLATVPPPPRTPTGGICVIFLRRSQLPENKGRGLSTCHGDVGN